MIKFIVLVLIFLIAGYLFNPYITSLVNYVSFGLNKIIFLVGNIGDILLTFLNTFSQYNYLMLMLAIFICIKMIFYIVDLLGGE